MLYLHSSNKLEVLATMLARIVQEAPAYGNPLAATEIAIARIQQGVFAKEIICVPSRSLQTWLALQIAQENTIAANIAFLSPRLLIEKAIVAAGNSASSEGFQPFLSHTAPTDPLDKDICSWRLLRILPGMLDQYPQEFAPLRYYLQSSEDSILSRYLLCNEIAGVFNDYLIYRPQMIMQWLKNPMEHGWQSLLVAQVVKDAQMPTLGERVITFASRIRQTDKTALLPARIALFGFSHLPPLFLFAIKEIAELTDVHIFAPNPSPDFWFDYAGKEKKTCMPPSTDNNTPTPLPNYPKGTNSLLSLWGGLLRDFWSLLIETPAQENEVFVPIARTSLLKNIQADIAENTTKEKATVIPREEFPSLQVVSCHSERRELEALKDFLLAAFSQDSSLLPKDILITAPNTAGYEPLLPLVFGMNAPLQYKVVGTRQENNYTAAFFDLVEKAKGRWTATAIISLLENNLIREANGFEEHEIPTVLLLIQEAGIRWGLDAQERTQLNLPSFAENSWRCGLQRLVLGYALRPTTIPTDNSSNEEDFLFNGISPVPGIEGDIAETLGKLVAFVDRLAMLKKNLQREFSPSDWRKEIAAGAQQFLGGEDELLNSALSDWEAQTTTAAFLEPLPFAVLYEYLLKKLQPEEHSEFISGAITFCSLLPLRPVPFKIICLLGMNADAFPRKEMRAGFNIITEKYLPGDKTRRNEDIHLFLEALLGASSSFYISYIGQSLKDNSILPPSVLVADLLDYIDNNYQFAECAEEKCRNHVFAQQPLQAFSQNLFIASNPQSYSKVNFNCALAFVNRQANGAKDSWGSSGSLESLNEQPTTVSIAELASFFRNPARFFLEQRLDVRLPRSLEDVSDDEPLALGGLERFRLGEALLNSASTQTPTKKQFLQAKALGIMPVGGHGELAWGKLIDTVTDIVARHEELFPAESLPDLEISLTIDTITLSGTIRGISKTGLTRCSFAKFRAASLLELWIEHLLLNTARDAEYPKTSHAIYRDATIKLKAVVDPTSILRRLLKIFLRGWASPLPFFPMTSWEFFKAVDGSIEIAWEKARKSWEGGFSNTSGERTDPHINLCFGSDFPFDQKAQGQSLQATKEFQKLAESVFSDIREHIDDKKLSSHR
ncbi:MAG: exodeoxyribonuclease V subunit gamma [Deltaproteobacteria bacterium]|nr:exodeoxyribonuclease V subunit gamma [Deltaproteobacteria bacterium]